ncbi:MAG: hypothetical protein IJ083_06260 [Clostridia bacterium]|nr:hypothetical protein [Clostridia bacterium]
MKLAFVYTISTPALEQLVAETFFREIGKFDGLIYRVPEALSEAMEKGSLTRKGAAQLMHTYLQAITDGADVIVNCCSTVRAAALEFEKVSKSYGVPMLQIDTEMLRVAGHMGRMVGVLATAGSTIEPTCSGIRAYASGRHIICQARLADVFGAEDPELYREKLISAARELAEFSDVIVLAQASMAFLEKDIAQATGKPCLSSPGLAAKDMKRIVKIMESKKTLHRTESELYPACH